MVVQMHGARVLLLSLSHPSGQSGVGDGDCADAGSAATANSARTAQATSRHLRAMVNQDPAASKHTQDVTTG
jgi:hypothetical protein